MIEWGYDSQGLPVLEREEDIQKRKNVIKQIVPKCNCKSGCSTAKCGCRRNSLNCIFCSCESCQNQGEAEGKDSDERHAINAPNMLVHELQSEKEEIGLTDDEGGSSSDESAAFKSDMEREGLEA